MNRLLLKRSGEKVGDMIGAENKVEGLEIKLLPCKKLFKSCQNEALGGSGAGEKNPGEIGGSVAGAGVKIPGI